jgi:hypothetical protein
MPPAPPVMMATLSCSFITLPFSQFSVPRTIGGRRRSGGAFSYCRLFAAAMEKARLR